MGNVYVIISKSSMLKEEEEKKIINKYSGIDYDLQSHDLEESSLALLLEDINTIPFLTEHKIVILTNPIFMKDETKYDEKLVKSFESYLKNPIETTTLIILLSSKDDVSQRFYKILKNECIVSEIQEAQIENIKEHVIATLERESFKYDIEAIDEVISRCQNDTERVLVEIDKLMLYKYDEKYIGLKDVKILVSKDLEDNIFELVNAHLAHDTTKALDIYNDLKVLNEDSARIISLLLNKFNELYLTKLLADSGYDQNQIAEAFNVKSGRAYYMLKNIKSLTLKDIKQNMNELINIDFKIKNGLIDKSIALETYLVK